MKRIYQNSRSFNKVSNDTDDYGKSVKMEKPLSEGEVKDHISILSVKGLNKSTYSFKADPYDSENAESSPYPPFSKFNKKIGGTYKGEDNIDGGAVKQYNNSVRSKFLNYFDVATMKIQPSYRYLPALRPDTEMEAGRDGIYRGSGLVDQRRQVIDEATSQLQSTTFTQMAIYDYVVETDLAMGSAPRTNIGGKIVYDRLPDVIYAGLTYYQLFLQQALNTFNWHNSFRLKMGTAIRNSWNRETPLLNSLFGLFKKKSFMSVVESVALCFPGEFVDVGWARQLNTLTVTPSRRSDGYMDPVLELQTRLRMPTVFRLYTKVINSSTGEITLVKIFDQDDLEVTVSQAVESEGKCTFDKAVNKVNDLMSLGQITLWARQNSEASIETQNSYANKAIAYFNVINTCFKRFKESFNDLREVLDTCTRAGLVTWVKGFKPSVTRDTKAFLFDNQLVDDIFRNLLGGADIVQFNQATKRWRTFSMWGLYNGIPGYDSKSGGAFLTFSSKQIIAQNDDDGTQAYLPLMFEYDPTWFSYTNADTPVVTMVSRKGDAALIKAQKITMATDPVLSRLVPLPSQSGYQLRVPTLSALNVQDGNDTISCRSIVYKEMLQLFGSGAIKRSEAAWDLALDSDVIAIYEFEIDDLSNEAQAYARATAPLRGTEVEQDAIGFSTFGGQGS